MSDNDDTKKEGRFINVLSFSLMLDKDASLSPTLEVSKLDAEDFIEFMDDALPDFSYTHDLANLIRYGSGLVDDIEPKMEEYWGVAAYEKEITEPAKKTEGTVEEVYKAIKSTKLN